MDCLDTGYRGRMGVHELLMNNSDIKKMILRRAPAAEVHHRRNQGGHAHQEAGWYREDSTGLYRLHADPHTVN